MACLPAHGAVVWVGPLLVKELKRIVDYNKVIYIALLRTI